VATRALWIGTYPPAGIGTPPGRGEGIYRVDLDLATGALGVPRRVVETPAPSFVVQRADGTVLYAADESEVGRVAAFRVHDDGLEPLGAASSGGAYPCHLLLDGDRLYVANYGDGALGVLPLAGDGSFASDEPQVLRHAGSGPDAERQEGPHAHFVALAPGGHVLVVDLGTDEVRRYARTASGLEPAGVAATLPPGTGPRHLVFSAPAGTWRADGPAPAGGPALGDGPALAGGRAPADGSGAADPEAVVAYVTGELDATVHVLAWDAAIDTGEPVQALPALGPRPPDRCFGADSVPRGADVAANHRSGGTGGPGEPDETGEPDERRGPGERGGPDERGAADKPHKRDERGVSDAADEGDLGAAWADDTVPAPSHLALDGGELVVGVRGPEVLSRFAVGDDGLLTHREDQPLPARTPRYLAVVGAWTVVAEQVPGAVTVLAHDGTVVATRAVPSAACLLPAV
jgi:hypothetical protein